MRRRRFSGSACLPNRQAELIQLQRLLIPRCQIGSFTCAVRGLMRTACPPQCYGARNLFRSGWERTKVPAPVGSGCAGQAAKEPPAKSELILEQTLNASGAPGAAVVSRFAGFLVLLALVFSRGTALGAAAPANDKFTNRIPLAGTSVTATGSNVGASKEAGEPDHAGNAGGKSVWWSWTSPANGELTLTTDDSTNTDGSPLDTLLAVYRGATLSALSVVA